MACYDRQFDPRGEGCYSQKTRGSQEMEDSMGEQVNSILQELRVKPLDDFHCLETFCSGVESMDIFIRNNFRMSVDNQ